MAAVTLTTYTNELENKFGYRPMQNLMAYLATYNANTQTLAIDANTNDIQTTGTGLCFFEGDPHILPADAALDISACTEGTESAWATATSYTLGTSVVTNDSVRYLCIQTHTSAAATEPGTGENWVEYWEARKHGATNASGTSIAAGYDQWFMATAKRDGTITLWESGDAALHDNAVCKVPHYDPKIYCVVGFLHIANETASAFVVGTTGLDTGSVTDTFIQAIGPVFPHKDNWDAN